MSYLIHGNQLECIEEEILDRELKKGYFLRRSAEDRAAYRLENKCGKENGRSLGMLGKYANMSYQEHFS